MGVDAEQQVRRAALWRMMLACAGAGVPWLGALSLAWVSRPYLLDVLAQLGLVVVIVSAAIATVLYVCGHRRAGAACAVGLGVLAALFVRAHAGGIPGAPAARGVATAPVRVVVYNAHVDNSLNDPALEPWLLGLDADLVCIIEPPTGFPGTHPAIVEAFPHAVVGEPGMDWPVVILSRTPFEAVELVPFADATMFSMPARRTLRLSTRGGAEVLFTSMYPRSLRTVEFWRHSMASVAVDASVVRRWLAGAGPDHPPLIIAGDFNATATGRTHAIMRTSGLRPWSPLLGAGTFPALLPRWVSLPLDRIWASEGVWVERWRVGPRMRSDHRPVVLDLAVRRRGGSG